MVIRRYTEKFFEVFQLKDAIKEKDEKVKELQSKVNELKNIEYTRVNTFNKAKDTIIFLDSKIKEKDKTIIKLNTQLENMSVVLAQIEINLSKLCVDIMKVKNGYLETRGEFNGE